MSMKRPVTWKDVVPAALGVVAFIAAILTVNAYSLPIHVSGWVLVIMFLLCVVAWTVNWRSRK
jgi:hypothetical protein